MVSTKDSVCGQTAAGAGGNHEEDCGQHDRSTSPGYSNGGCVCLSRAVEVGLERHVGAGLRTYVATVETSLSVMLQVLKYLQAS